MGVRLTRPGTGNRFRKAKSQITDNSIDSRRNRQADQLANNGRLMDLSAYIMLATAGPTPASRAAWADIDVLPSPVALPLQTTPLPTMIPLSFSVPK